MQIRRVSKYIAVILVAISGLAILNQYVVNATTLESSNYKMTETQFGIGSAGESCSDEYCAIVSIGDSSGPGTTATFYDIKDENKTPLLEMIIEGGDSSLGTLSTEKTGTRTATVKIRNTLTDGYTLHIIGDTPKYEGRALMAMDTATPPVAGIEQFGLNVVENTSPGVGSNPVQEPTDGMFGFAAPGYDIPDLFKYVSGDVIARGLPGSGETSYTISMVVNVSTSTPAGHYVSDFSAIIVPAF